MRRDGDGFGLGMFVGFVAGVVIALVVGVMIDDAARESTAAYHRNRGRMEAVRAGAAHFEVDPRTGQTWVVYHAAD